MSSQRSAVGTAPEFHAKPTDESEWMWVGAESCNDEAGILFGKLDSVPMLETDLRSSDELAESYGKIVEYRKASDLEKQV